MLTPQSARQNGYSVQLATRTRPCFLVDGDDDDEAAQLSVSVTTTKGGGTTERYDNDYYDDDMEVSPAGSSPAWAPRAHLYYTLHYTRTH